jgi:hypothetical protein
LAILVHNKNNLTLIQGDIFMTIEPTQQPSDGPADKPIVKNPVRVTMDLPLFYATERGPVAWNHSIFCGKAFADTVLKQCSEILTEYNYALVHLGVYNPRQARHKDGSLIQPPRWSNHAYAEAMDFKGVITDGGEGTFLDIAAMKSTCPDKLQRLLDACHDSIVALGRKPEIVDERGWYHIGLWPDD